MVDVDVNVGVRVRVGKGKGRVSDLVCSLSFDEPCRIQCIEPRECTPKGGFEAIVNDELHVYSVQCL